MSRFDICNYFFAAIFMVAASQATAEEPTCDDFLTREFFTSATREIVHACLEQGRSVDERDDRGNTPLHLAVAYAPNALVTWVLMQAGSDLDRKNLAKHTPMHMAAAHAINPMQLFALAFSGAEVDKGMGSDGCPWSMAPKWPPMVTCLTTPLHLAARRPEAVNVVAALIAEGAAIDIYAGKDLVDIDEDLTEDRYLLPLHLAARHAGVETVRTLLQAGAEVDAEDYGRRERTALHYAATRKDGEFEIVQALLDAGASADAEDFEDATPLMLAASYSTAPEIFSVLLDAAEKPCVENARGMTALKYHDENKALERDDIYWVLHARCNE